MPQFERRLYDPAEDAGLDDDTMEEEGSRLPLLIVIALVVLASFAGVVWLAYTQGVQRGREDAPRIVAAQQGRLGTGPKYSDLKIYQRATPDEGIKEAAASPPHQKPVEPLPKLPAAAAKPAPQAILPPPVANPLANTPAKPRVTAQATVVKSQTANAVPRPTAVPNNPPALARMDAAPRQANGAPRAITALANNAATANATTPAPPAPTPAPDQVPNTQAAAINAAAPSANAAAQGFVLQIGSYTSEAEASASWQTYKEGHPAVAGYAPDIQTADLGRRGTWYRLRIGPFATLQEAAAACAKLRAQGTSCLPTKR